MATGFNTQNGNGKYRLQFETDNKEHYLRMQEIARRCVDGVPVTKADRLRAMSDEELADELNRRGGGDMFCRNKPECGRMLNADEEIPDEWCRMCALEWLKQPAEGER